MSYRIDLYSDTKTRPSPEMREFMLNAEVGDELAGEDPTVNKLVEMTCERLGKEDGLFLPSGTMCNQIAIRTHCQPSDEIIADKTAHIIHYEVAGAAALSGSLISPLNGTKGVFTKEQFKDAIRQPNNYQPRTALVVMEQTSNSAGGTVWPLSSIKEVSQIADENNIAKHMDGARLFNAVVKDNVPAKTYAQYVDSVWIDLSKGLGCPVGAVLTGSKEFIQKARRWKHQFGGAMRQAGIIAAAGIYALENNIDRLAVDHSNAVLLADILQNIDGIMIDPFETNMVYFDIQGLGITSEELNDRIKPYGLRFSIAGKYRLRAVTHLDVNKDQIQEVGDILTEVL
ncbi:MAG: threonine aldolase family protein [Candidatus Kariarchaeaceae archaeon]|jgi:threonine aldolase